MTAVNPFLRHAERQQGEITGALLKFNGDFLSGRDDVVIPIGTTMTAVMSTYRCGYMFFDDGTPQYFGVGYVLKGHVPPARTKFEGGTQKETKSKNSDRLYYVWNDYESLVFVDADGNKFTFSAHLYHNRLALQDLSADFGLQMGEHPGQDPVVSLGVWVGDNGRKNPQFKIIGWTKSERPVNLDPSQPMAEPPVSDVAPPPIPAKPPAQSLRDDMMDEVPF